MNGTGRFGLVGSLEVDISSVLSVVGAICGWSGFIFPLAYELLLPIELHGRESWEEEDV
jgi:hypothetical protein